MSNVNTGQLLVDLPAQTVATASAVLTVPAAGLYAGYPSPAFAATKAWYLSLTDTVNTNLEFDGHPFKVRLVGEVTIGAANSTFTPSIYNGTSTTVGSNTSLGIGAATGSLTAATTYDFWLEALLLWNSVTTKLTGFYFQFVNNVIQNSALPVAITGTSPATLAAINFLPTFAFGTTQAGNIVTVSEFAIDRA